LSPCLGKCERRRRSEFQARKGRGDSKKVKKWYSVKGGGKLEVASRGIKGCSPTTKTKGKRQRLVKGKKEQLDFG